MYSTGAEKSPYDIRTTAYAPTGVPKKGGTRYLPEDIEDQHKVGICTAISLTQNARKALGIKFSADFQYLLQKKYYDLNWKEGSSIFHALKVGKTIGLLPEKHWTFTTEKDRTLSYEKYIKKLQAIPESEIERLKLLTVKLTAYEKVPVDPDLMAQAICESEAGILCRFNVGKEWWTNPIEPIRPPKVTVSGHAITESNFNGQSGRVANTWGTDWADQGTGYFLYQNYIPTEAWIPHYNSGEKYTPSPLLDSLQKVVNLYQQLLNKLK